MSGIYIKNAKKPRCCCQCHYGIENCDWDHCPIIFVPDHGDLIDADELIAGHNGIFDNCMFPSDVREEPVLIPGDFDE